MNRPEVGVSIQVGIKDGEEAPVLVSSDNEDVFDPIDGPVFIEDPFGDEPY